MRTAIARAARSLHAKPVPGEPEAWGWRGRTLSQPVTTTRQRAWLRLHSVALENVIDTFWNGAVDAQRDIPPSVPRPRLLAWHDWTDGGWAYRAELHEHVAGAPIAGQAILSTDPDLPKTWWTNARAAMDDIAAVRTDRATIHIGFLGWAMPHYLATSIKHYDQAIWTTAHGDFHYANLCGPDLRILDWEGWGTAPAGYDAATLHSYSLLIPTIAERIREEFTEILDTPSGRFAELAVITELLHTTTHGANLKLVEPLRQRATLLLGRTVAVPRNRPVGY